jgi:5-methylcytosine-specific restriction endonuclease McrA
MPHSPKKHSPKPPGVKHVPTASREAIEAHLRERRERRDSWYSNPRWRSLRRLFLSRQPFCQACAEVDVVTAATEVDHIVPRRADPSLSYDVHNLQALCKSCHSRKTRKQNGLEK